MYSEFLSLLFSTTLAGVVLLSIVDAAAKSLVLLCLAVVVCSALRRASASTRHLIWFSTLSATLAIPVFSLCVPQWRVLPEWMAVTRGAQSTQPFVTARPPVPALPVHSQAGPLAPGDSFPQADKMPPMDEATEQVLKKLADAGVDPQEAISGLGVALLRLTVLGISALVATGMLLVWCIGAGVLLWPMVRSAWSLHRLAASLCLVTDGSIAAATAKIASELGIPTPRLYLGSDGVMPMVWGIRRGRVLLPAEATKWDAGRLRAVLLHEMAHLHRFDVLTQAIAQVARALFWFNPLAWLALRNLRVEQEQACDDYVLRGGVKPSDYAGHVLELATQLQPAPRAASVALAMAVRMRIEDRLHTILDATRDRRSVSRWLAASTVIIAGSAAVAMAMLHASDGSNNQLIVQDQRSEKSQERPALTPPQDKHAQELFKTWQAAARSDGKIPGALIGQLGAKVEEFVRNNRNDVSGAPYAKKVEPILSRFHADHDWLPDLALALLNDLATLSTIPIETTLWADAQNRIYQPGQPLPADLKDAPWGEPTAEGLRVARPLDPRAPTYPVGTALRSRILVHNDGKQPILLRTESWMQPAWSAHDAKGQPLPIESTFWTTLANVRTVRLAPGEFIEIATPGLGVGKGAGKDEWADVRVGSWIDVADGVAVTLTPVRFVTVINDSRVTNPPNGQKLKLQIIRERLDRERPLPATGADRELIVRRVTKDIFGNAPTPDEISAFLSDQSDDPVTALANRLLHRAGLVAFMGEAKPGEITFSTTPADPDAVNRPKVAIGPGRYTLGDHVRLIIVGKLVDGRPTTDAEIRFWGEKATDEPPGPPHKITVPAEFGTWAITCRPGTGILWVLTSGNVRKIDYSNPAQVKETPITRGSRGDMPDEFREAVKRTLTNSDVPPDQIKSLLAKEPQAVHSRTADSDKDVPAAAVAAIKSIEKTPGGGVKWGKAQDGLQAGIRSADERQPPRVGETVPLEILIRNVGSDPIEFTHMQDVVVTPGTGKPVAGLLYEFPPKVLDKEGNELRWAGGGGLNTGDVPLVKHSLAPSTMVVAGRVMIALRTPKSPTEKEHLTLFGEPGTFKVSQRFWLQRKPGVNETLLTGTIDLHFAEAALEFLAKYPKLADLSLRMTEQQFPVIAEKHDLQFKSSRGDGQTVYSIPTGDGHTVIVTFRDGKCSGIQRVRGEE